VFGPAGDRKQRIMLDPQTDTLTVPALFQAYYDCRLTKRNSASALLFEEHLERNLMDLYYELLDGSYWPGPSIVFVVEHPKVREVWAADFRDRIVHHLLYNQIADRFHRRYIHDSYACIPNKGTHRAVARMEHFARSVTRNYSQPGYVLKMDVANFFVSINRLILDDLMTPHIPETWWLALMRTILHRDPVPDAQIAARSEVMRRVPRHKSLFYAPPNTGLAIGSLNSQSSANIIMNVIDQFAKHALKLTHYVRYVDDITVFGTDAKALALIPAQIDHVMQTRLKIRLHPNKTSINRIEHGFDALGYVVRLHARYLRRSTVRNGFKKIEGMCRARVPLQRVRQTAHSYFGIFNHADAWATQGRLASTLHQLGYGAAVPTHINHSTFAP
jgi:RNA-directed DNA polymerase